MMANQNEEGHSRDDESPKDESPADPKVTDWPNLLSSEQMETLAAQVTQTILKQLASSGAKANDQQAGPSSSSWPGDQGERGLPQPFMASGYIDLSKNNIS